MLSRKYKCVFVHIPKVAGQSIERVFLGLHGLSWDDRAALLLSPNDNPDLGPPRLAHLKASEYVSCGHMSQHDFELFYKFSFVRNPWERLVSVYRYLGLAEDMSFKQFLVEDFSATENWEPRLMKAPQYDYLFTENGEQLVDYIYRFEELQAGFDKVCGAIGMPATDLPHANKTGKGRSALHAIKQVIKMMSPFHKIHDQHEHYTSYYDDEAKEIVANLYAREIEYFKYRFED